MEKENFRESQYGWTIVEKWTGCNGVDIYDIQNNQKNKYKVPQELWDALSSATYRAETYRKSRDHFRESRDIEKERASTTVSNLVANHLRLTKDLHNEIDFLSVELENVETTLRHYKAGVILLSVVAIVCFCATFII